MQTIILAGSCVGALTTIVVTCVKIFKIAIKVRQWAETNEKHIKENYLDIKRLVITSPYMPLGERIKACDEYIAQGGNGEVKHLYNTLIGKLDEGEQP
jgi:hypothetical protein